MFKRKLLSMMLLAGMLFGQSVSHVQAAICNQVQFVSDLTAPDGATFAPNTAFTKKWRLKNIGTCTWTTTYTLVWVGGDAIGAPGPVRLPVSVAPGQMLDISVNLTTPNASGNYKGLWKLSNAAGAQFGIGATANDPFWVSISVLQTSAIIYDFVANAPYAQWKSGAGPLPFPVTGGDDRGYAYQVNNPHLEDDSLDAAPGLMTVPQNKLNGYIQATYPEFDVQRGDQLQTLVNCEFAATSCYATFRIDYRLANGAQRTLWTWREAYDNKFYRKSINLDTLAGKRVQFIFMVLASGSASGDRAIWGSPRILRAGTTPPSLPPTLTPLPPPAPTLTPFASPPPTIAPVGCEKATFVSDVTVPDGTLFSPGTAFIKTWRLKNSGSCTWTNAFKLVFYNGEQMGAPTSVNVTSNIVPGATVDLTVNMTAPATAGTYRGYWIMSNATGRLFGIGTNAANPIWVEVNVSGSSPSVSGYDFAANACAAQWKSGAGILPCPGTEGDIKGYSINLNSTQLEDGTIGPAPSLLIAPESKYNGYIQGVYPLFTVLPGDRFRGSTGCAYGSNCYVTFRLDYMTTNGAIKTFWTWRESNDRRNNSFDLNLAPLAGQNVRFILTVLATGSATNDKATWTAPYIVRLDTSGQVPPTLTPTNTPVTTPGTIVPNPLIRKLFMFDAFNGWAISSSYVLRTTDGGTTWYNVTMPGVQFVGNAFFQNATRGWVFGPSPDMQSNLGVLFRTTDGGHTWTQYNVPFNGGYIQFINDANGFVLSGLPSGMFKHAVDLYQTTDGGATWVRKYTNNPLDSSQGTGLPFSGNKNGMTFRDTLRGWVSGESPLTGSVYLYKTNDSGTTWAQQTLPLPSGYSNAPMSTVAPTFFNANDGILPVWMTLDVGKRDLFIYSTRDGGNTWTRSTSFSRQGWNTDFASITDGFAWNTNGYMQVTRNSGASWTQVASNVNFGTDIPIIDFVSSTTGWIVQNQVNDVSPIYRTTNGGATWTLLSPTQPPATSTPLPPPTETPVPQDFNTFGQNLVNALNARNFDLVKSMMGQSFGFAFWQSQGFSSTPDEAIQQLQNYLGATPLTANVNQDLNALMGGLNPYGIMGLDPTTSKGLFVSGWGPDGQSEAILYSTRLPNGSLYWNSVLIAPSGFIPDAEPITHESFCADTRITTLLEQLKGSINQSNGDMFAGLVSPLHGVDVRLWAYAAPVNFNTNTARTVFTSTDTFNWGGGPSGTPDVGTFQSLIQPKLLEVFNAPNMETYCDDLTKVYPLATPWPYPEMRYYNLYKPASDQFFDFRTWLIGFEYVNGQPYISALVTIVWEP